MSEAPAEQDKLSVQFARRGKVKKRSLSLKMFYEEFFLWYFFVGYGNLV
jgi:hypothetical protein